MARADPIELASADAALAPRPGDSVEPAAVGAATTPASEAEGRIAARASEPVVARLPFLGAEEGAPLTVRNALSGAEICTIRVRPEQTLAETAALVRVARAEARAVQRGVVVFVDDKGKLLHERQTLEHVFPRWSGEALELSAVEQDPAMVAVAMRMAELDHILAFFDGFRGLPDARFGEEMAEQLYRSLLAGGKLEGRAQFCTQERLIVQSREDTWTLSRRGLTLAGHREDWRSKEAFVQFWSSMSEKRIAALFAAPWCRKLGLLKGTTHAGKLGGKVSCWVNGAPTVSKLRSLAGL